MKEALKNSNECVLYKDDKEERHNKLANIRKILYSEFESGYLIFDVTNYEVGDSSSIIQSKKNQEKEIVDKLNELRNSLLNVLVERRNVVFYAQWFYFKSHFYI